MKWDLDAFILIAVICFIGDHSPLLLVLLVAFLFLNMIGVFAPTTKKEIK